MKRRRGQRGWSIAVTVIGFLAGAMVMAFVDRGFPHMRLPAASYDRAPADISLPADPTRAPTSRAEAVGALPVPTPMSTPRMDAEPLAELRSRRLELPVQGTIRENLRDSFDETRGSTHRHEAIDIMAPRNTPILAVEGGTIARLFESTAGGTTVYQFDPSIRYVYYYAHLQRYADGVEEGRQVKRGQVLGYVGTSGNASKDVPHLHFAIFRLTDKKQWWDGKPIDPYHVLK